MLTFISIIGFFSFFILIYIFIGYPVLLHIISLIRSTKPVHKKKIRPQVTIIISCYNEENIIREKLENTIQLEYPKEKLEILVVSDASTDRTDSIVKEYKDKGVILIRQEDRKGKTAALNQAVSKVKGGIIVFSDANAMYQKDAICHLVENFSDAEVGFVVGVAKYEDTQINDAAKSENVYWNYEIILKKLESKIYSVVGGDGAIYAIRSELYEPLLETDINDFVNPLQIIEKGYRGIYEPNAICYEKTAGSIRKEFQRKVRIVNRSFNGLLRVPSVLNPLQTGLFSLQIISHKLLRWFTPIFMILFGFSAVIQALVNQSFIFQWLSILMILFFWCAYIGYLLPSEKHILNIFYYPYFFVTMNIALISGIIKTIQKDITVTWSTVREKDDFRKKDQKWIHMSIHLFILVLTLTLIEIFGSMTGISFFGSEFIFWISLMIVFYVYLIYPGILFFLSKFYTKPIEKKEITPEVTLLICAYNEEAVIEQKVQNCFDLDYPPDKLTFIIASDGSSDQTVTIVSKYKDNNQMILKEFPERRGKTSLINHVIKDIQSEIVVFSDANTMLAKNAIRKLVQNFNDPSVGCVSSDVVLINENTTFGETESLYYSCERWIQQKESDIHSLIGADGGMYAIRRNLFHAPSDNIILDDFIISMNVALKGKRVIYEKEAVATEKGVVSDKAEFFRKSRVVAGAIQSIKQNEGIPSLNQHLLFFCYFSHKFLRWMVPLFLIAMFLSSSYLYLFVEKKYWFLFWFVQILFYLLAICGIFLKKTSKLKWLTIPLYFCLVNSAAFWGIVKGILNKQSVKWRIYRAEK